MYVPKHFQEDDLHEIKRLIREYPFATLVSTSVIGSVASHVPLELDEQRDGTMQLVGHLARANPQWQSLTVEADVLAIFSGPHAYISPDWYGTPAVPTWNYQSVHLYGRPIVTHDPDEIRATLAGLLSRHHRPVTEDSMEEDLALSKKTMDALVRNVVGIRVVVDRIEAASKLSQNRSSADQASVIEHLRQSKDSASRAVAAAMERLSGE